MLTVVMGQGYLALANLGHDLRQCVWGDPSGVAPAQMVGDGSGAMGTADVAKPT